MPHTSIEIEHRLTTVEVIQDSHTREHRSHQTRLAELERKVMTPRDWLMVAGGLMAIMGALLGKIDWQTALAMLAKN